MTTNNNQITKSNGQALSELSFSEAPASWNTRYVDPNGFECQLTIRAESGSELLEKAASAIAYLLKTGCTPYVYRAGPRTVTSKPQAPTSSNGDNSNPAWCPLHECEMKRWDKNGRTWYSHKTDEGWCTGKASK